LAVVLLGSLNVTTRKRHRHGVVEALRCLR